MLPLVILAAPVHAAGVARPEWCEVVADPAERTALTPVGKDGVLVIGSDKRGKRYTFTGYDTTLKRIWSENWAPKDGRGIESQTTEGGRAWFVFRRGRKELSLLRVELATGALTQIDLDAPEQVYDLRELRIVGDDAWLLSSDDALGDPGGVAGTVLHVDLASKAVTVVDLDRALKLASFGPAATELTAIGIRDDRRVLHNVQLAPTTDEVTLTPVERAPQNYLSTARVALDDGAALIVGTYAPDRKDDRVQGLYTSRVEGGKPGATTFYNLGSLPHFFDYLTPEARVQIVKGAGAAAKAGEEFDVNGALGKDVRLQLGMHAPVRIGDAVVVVSEVYVPEYVVHKKPTTTYIGGVADTTFSEDKELVGYRYREAYVAAFSPDGGLVWDLSFPIDPVLISQPASQLGVLARGDHLKLWWLNGPAASSFEVDGKGVRGALPESTKWTEFAIRNSGGQALTAFGGAPTATDHRTEWWYDDWFFHWRSRTEDGKTTFTCLRAR